MTTENLPTTLVEVVRYFSDPDTCLSFMVSLRWPDGVVCPRCGSREVTFLANARVWKCRVKHDHQKFSIKVGTVMEDSPIGLDKWLPAIWLLVNAKNGTSSYELHRALGVTQKTAWFLLHRIRLAMQQGTFEKMSGQVEADETSIGGLARNMHKDKKAKKITGTGSSGKAIVMGLLERHGIDKSQKIIDTIGTEEKKGSRVRAKVVPNTDKETLHGEVKEHIKPGSELFTDAHISYRGLDPEYVHQFVDHAEAYVKDQVVHTNGLENFWSLLKRGIKSTYVSVEPFHLTRYVDEQAFRCFFLAFSHALCLFSYSVRGTVST
jgi:transposase-like protein